MPTITYWKLLSSWVITVCGCQWPVLQELPVMLWCSIGSVLGPILFTLHTQPLCDDIQRNHFDYKFADDTEIRNAVHVSDFPGLSRQIEHCFRCEIVDGQKQTRAK